MSMFGIRTPHEILKSGLCSKEEIWIYDEPHRVAVTVENINGLKYYTVQVFLPQRYMDNYRYTKHR